MWSKMFKWFKRRFVLNGKNRKTNKRVFSDDNPFLIL